MQFDALLFVCSTFVKHFRILDSIFASFLLYLLRGSDSASVSDRNRSMMEQYLNNELGYMADDYFDMAEFDYNNDDFGEVQQQMEAAEGSDFGREMDCTKQKTDTSAYEFRNGKDMQGIPWDRLNYGREKCREMRLKQYRNYENLAGSREALEKKYQTVENGSTFYDFQFNTRLVKSTIVHFQLRNLLWATSKHDVYTAQNHSVMHWSSVLQRGKQVLNVAGKVVSNQKCQESSSTPLSRIQISTMVVKDNLLVAGGFQGELVCQYLNNSGVAFSAKVANDDNAITNAVDIYQTPTGSLRVMAANNDCHVRIFDVDKFSLLNRLSYSWSVNSTSVSPDGKILAVLGDSTDCLLADSQSGKAIGTLKGHLDYSFSSAWHPNGRLLATGNQDKTCRLWDVRNLSQSVAVLKGRMGAIRGIKFSADGRFMAMAEPADFVHIFDAAGAGYCKAQEIDLFGEIAGVSFSPDTEALFVGVADRVYGSLLEFKRRHEYGYLDSFI